jgi:hypothetical protein
LALITGMLCGALAGCSRSPSQPDLTQDERRLVDLYVRLTVLESLRQDAPDSSEAGFRRLAQSYDSTAVRRRLDALSTDPRRWQVVYDAIARRLRELEEHPDPGAARRQVLGDEPVRGARPRLPAPDDSGAGAEPRR